MKNIFKNKSLLITGGTGSFGYKFTEILLKKYYPKRIVIFSRDEFKQYEMAKKFKNDSRLRFFIGDVRDFNRLNYALHNVDYVVHAAALKHVNAAEYNPTEYILTNIKGAENVIKASIQNKVTKVIALSTDKAVNPINLYGATKLVSDKLFSAANNIKGNQKIAFSIVRYGNVTNSRGSVIPFFKEQIKQKSKNFFITDKKMTRFLITLEDASNFVISSFNLMQGGEILVPKIRSIKITDLAKTMNSKMGQKIIGIRPGEKIDELMTSSDDRHLVLEFKNYYIVLPTINFDEKKINFKKNIYGESGKKVKPRFEYSSGKSLKKYTKNEIDKFLNS